MEIPVESHSDSIVTSTDQLSPVRRQERINSIDVLRGCALLGILAVNIQSFALSGTQAFNLSFLNDAPRSEWYSWLVANLFFHSKMYPIFSMLFGAGLVLMDERAESKGKSLSGIYYRRLSWLFLIGLCHAYFIWEGDILVVYAMCGAMLFPFRRVSPKLLLFVGLLSFLMLPLAATLCGYLLDFVRVSAVAAGVAGEQATEWQTVSSDIWRGIEVELDSTAEKLAEEKAIYRGGYWRLFLHRAPMAFAIEVGALFVMNWGFLGIMFCGVALMRTRVFDASRSFAFYATCVIMGYGGGLSLIGSCIGHVVADDFALGAIMKVQFFQSIGCALVVVGHVGLVMTICKLDFLSVLTKPFAAAGRMALTNYLSQSLICAIIFFGWGFGQFAHRTRFELWGIVVSIWCFQLIISPIWLTCFRFGPMEWLWRSLTYWKWQSPSARTGVRVGSG